MTAEGSRHVYEKMAELPFDSFRKCMTVIVKDSEGVSFDWKCISFDRTSVCVDPCYAVSKRPNLKVQKVHDCHCQGFRGGELSPVEKMFLIGSVSHFNRTRVCIQSDLCSSVSKRPDLKVKF